MTDLEATQRQARELLNSRIDSVTELVKARQRATGLEAQLVQAKKDEKKAYFRAIKDGWSADELKRLGLDHKATRRRQTAKKPVETEPSDDGDA